MKFFIRRVYLFIFFLVLLFIPTRSVFASLDLGDKSGNGNNLTNSGATEWTTDFPFAASTKAVALSRASTQYLYAADSSSLSVTGNLTLESWVKFDTLPSSSENYGFMGKNHSDVGDFSYSLSLYNDAGTRKLDFFISNDGTGSGSTQALVPWNPSSDIWYHVAVVYTASAGTADFYVNGVPQGTQQSGLKTSIFNNAVGLAVGQTGPYSTSENAFNGKLDDVRIWNVARTAVQIANNYNIALTGNESGLVAYWPFESVPTPSPTPTPTPLPVRVEVSPASSSVNVGTPFNVDVVVDGGGQAFNAAQATISVSSNLTVTGLHNATSNPCNFQYTQTPSVSSPSFAGAIFGSSATSCKVYTLTLTPNAIGTGTIVLTNASIKSYSNNSELLTGVQDGSFSIGTGPTPTPTPTPGQITIGTYPSETYSSTLILSGTKDATISSVYVNGSTTGVTYPTNTTWQTSISLSLGSNTFNMFGIDGNNNQTPTQTITISRHILGDINGDGVVNLTDASLFAVDWGKTSNLTYPLSDMNGDGIVDLTDYSILAKLETP